MPLTPKRCPNCDHPLPWLLDTSYLAEFGRFLSHSPRRLYSGPEIWQFVEDPRKWIREALVGNEDSLRAEFEAERKAAAC